MHKLRTLPAGLWDSLFDVGQPPVRYLTRALLLDLPVTFAVGTLVAVALPDSGPDFSAMSPAMMLPMMCVVAPVIETALMAACFSILRLFTRNLAYLAILSTLVWVGVHSLGAAAHGLGILWAFLLFSICYLRWETRSVGWAFWMTAALHALHNLVPALLLACHFGTR